VDRSIVLIPTVRYSAAVLTFDSSLLNVVLVVAGMVMLYLGGSSLVGGAGGIALNLRIPPLVVGLTVVAFGTSAPELFVSVLSAVQGKMGVSIGNVIGSNVINIALILGIAALARPSDVHRLVIRVDTPVMFGTYAVFIAAGIAFGSASMRIGGVIDRLEGAILVALLAVYVYTLYRRARTDRENAALVVGEAPSSKVASRAIWLDAVLVVLGVALLAGGAEAMVRGASWLAVNVFGASERFVGIAIVAFGTSLPELFTTITSIARGEMDISVGNIIGSNIFNSLMVLGATSLIRPIEIGETDFSIDIAFMLGISILLYLFLLSRRRVPRIGGALFLAVYTVYVVFLTMTRSV
jgi:cation:H+ antiporter